MGVLGIFLRRFHWPRPAFLIGFVLADQAEVYVYQATQIALVRFDRDVWEGLDYVASPVALAILAVTALSVWLGARQSKSLYRSETAAGEARKCPGVVFAAAVAGFLALAFADSLLIDVLIDKIFPALVCGAMTAAGLVLLARMARRPAGDPLFADREAGEDADAPRGLWTTLGWFVSLLLLTALLGFVLALGIFFLVFLRRRAGADLALAVALTTAGIGGLLLLAHLIGGDFPPGVLQTLVELPWPLSGR